MDVFPTANEYFKQRITTFKLASDLFLALGNTGAATHRIWTGMKTISVIPETVDTSGLSSLIPTSDVKKVSALRHPDPVLCATQQTTHPGFQVRGSWKKIAIKKSENIAARMGFASFVWRRAYVRYLSHV